MGKWFYWETGICSYENKKKTKDNLKLLKRKDQTTIFLLRTQQSACTLELHVSQKQTKFRSTTQL